VLRRDEAEETEDEKHTTETTKAIQIESSNTLISRKRLFRGSWDSPSTNAESHQKPGTKNTDAIDTVLAQSEIICFGVLEAGLFQEVSD
jgi:hypothetical protein